MYHMICAYIWCVSGSVHEEIELVIHMSCLYIYMYERSTVTLPSVAGTSPSFLLHGWILHLCHLAGSRPVSASFSLPGEISRGVQLRNWDLTKACK